MTSAIRGSILNLTDNPFTQPPDSCFEFIEDGLVVMENGKVSAVGAHKDISGRIADDVAVTQYTDCIILSGFIDSHVHYPQTEIIGAFGRQLIDWLNDYTFVAEQKFADQEYARHVAEFFLRECLRAGTTTSAVFCAVYPESVEAFFEQSNELNMCNIAGKVLMDQNAPRALTDTPQTGYDDSKALIERWHDKGRQLYAVTPRFAITSSPEQMEMTGALWQEHPGTYLQSHLSENPGEIAWVKKMHPARKHYLDVYAHFGQLGPRSIYGHGIHLSEEEMQILHETDTSIAHCPTSNLFLGSGLFDLAEVMRHPRPLRCGLATDLGAGTNFCQLVTMNAAYKIAQLKGYSLNPVCAFYLITLGAAHALHLDHKLGSIAAGKDADITVLDLKATPLLEFRMQHAESIEDKLFVMMSLGDDRLVRATYVAGERLYTRD